MIKRVLILLVGLMCVGFAIAKTNGVVDFGSWRESSRARVSSTAALQEGELSGAAPEIKNSSNICLSADEISNTLRKFTSENYPVITGARTLLLNEAAKSRSCREEIVTALMKAMDKPNLDILGDKNSFYMWLYGAELLGDLKASEALDLLISHLNLVDKASFSLSMSHRPAVRGLIKMGSIAIPKLNMALKSNPDSEVRFYSVYCIAMIGGPSAVTSLREALASESDECVRHIISVSLDSFDDDGGIKDRGKWVSSLGCK